jgi:hypothetical protein
MSQGYDGIVNKLLHIWKQPKRFHGLFQVISGSNLDPCKTINVNTVLEFLHLVDMGEVSNVEDVQDGSVFRIRP